MPHAQLPNAESRKQKLKKYDFLIFYAIAENSAFRRILDSHSLSYDKVRVQEHMKIIHSSLPPLRFRTATSPMFNFPFSIVNY
jgi:hypothetical protein